MPEKRVNPNQVRLHRSYSVAELADCCGVHRNTVRNWRDKGLEPIDADRPTLFQGAIVRAFIARINTSRKSPCVPGTLYCFRCRQPREPAMGMVDYLPLRATSGDLRAICAHCEAIMHRRVRLAEINRTMPGCQVQTAEGQPSLNGRTSPSLNCDSDKKG